MQIFVSVDHTVDEQVVVLWPLVGSACASTPSVVWGTACFQSGCSGAPGLVHIPRAGHVTPRPGAGPYVYFVRRSSWLLSGGGPVGRSPSGGCAAGCGGWSESFLDTPPWR
eukprot:6056122-Pyramimonas_sp.AAC.1